MPSRCGPCQIETCPSPLKAWARLREKPPQKHRRDRAEEDHNDEKEPDGQRALALTFALAWIGVRAPPFVRLHRPSALSQEVAKQTSTDCPTDELRALRQLTRVHPEPSVGRAAQACLGRAYHVRGETHA